MSRWRRRYACCWLLLSAALCWPADTGGAATDKSTAKPASSSLRLSGALKEPRQKLLAFKTHYETAEAISTELQQQVTSLKGSLQTAEASSTRLSERLIESLAQSRRLESAIRRLEAERYWWARAGVVAGGGWAC